MIKRNKIVLTIVNLVIVVLSWLYVTYKIIDFVSLPSFELIDFTKIHFASLILVVMLMFVNWGIEAFKWKFSLRNIQEITFKKAFLSIIKATTVGLITPNRAGEPFARLSVLEEQNKQAGFSAAVVNSTSQLVITVISGCIALPFFVLTSQNVLGISLHLSVVLSVVLGISTIVIFFSIGKLASVLRFFPYIERFKSFTQSLTQTNYQTLLPITGLSAMRYAVFLLQFFFILVSFNVYVGIFNCFIAVSLVFLVNSAIPTSAIAELGIRCSAALFFIGSYSNNPIGITVATFGLWVINIVLPAVAGSIIILKTTVSNRSKD